MVSIQGAQAVILHPLSRATILCLHMGTADSLYLYTVAVMRDLAMNGSRYLPVDRSSALLSPIGSHPHHFPKPLTCTEDDDAHHNHCLVSEFCFLSPTQPMQHVHVPRPQTITPEGSVKHLWNAPQDTWHGD